MCKGCDLCVDACPQDSLKLSDRMNKLGYHYAVLVEDNCTGCINCALVCPQAIIPLYPTAKKSATKTSSVSITTKEPIAVISNVKGNLRFTISDVPDGGASI